MEYYLHMARPRHPSITGDQSPVIAPLARGFDVLRAFQSGDPPLRNQDIARRTGIPPSSVSRITGSLVALGYLVHDANMQAYSLTPAVLSFGQAFLGGIPLRYQLRPGMRDLADRYAASVALGARSGREMIYVECSKGQSPVPFRFDVGSAMPIMRSAMGWGYLAGLDEATFIRTMDQIRIADQELWPKLVRKIEQAREDVRTRGFCVSIGAFESGVHTVGVPAFTRPGEGVYGLICGAPAYSLSEEQLVTEIGPRLVWLARSVRQQEPSEAAVG
ncbi:IclR family transcriptional regulator [Bosea caraganae]|uniref:IclR family transcriptional regulator n=1 Tax=Bosea caraganae TaxID=2763117 RepID=A0A370KY85_9HYPH|nr:IclR family transcriptional regulator [Bosea caraganae]RDJ23876.1 IclR family transcriptional regulator [Bosea caraganae]